MLYKAQSITLPLLVVESIWLINLWKAKSSVSLLRPLLFHSPQNSAHHSCHREVIHMLYISLFTPLSACSHHSNHSFHLGSRGSENESVSGNPNMFNTIPQWWAHLRSRQADTTNPARRELSKPEGWDKNRIIIFLPHSEVQLPFHFGTPTPVSLGLLPCPQDTPHLFSRWCRAFPALKDTRFSLTVPIKAFSKKGALSPISEEGTNLFLQPCSFGTARRSTLYKAGLPSAPSETRAHWGCLHLPTQLELLLKHKQNPSRLQILCFKVSPPQSEQRASHPQKSLPDMLLSPFEAISTPSSHHRGETGPLFLLLVISPLLCSGVYQHHHHYFPSCLGYEVSEVVTHVTKFSLSFYPGLTRLSAVL